MKRAVIGAIAMAGAFVIVVSACSLGLDASRIAAVSDGATPVETDGGSAFDAPTSFDAPLAPDASAPECVHDTDCTSTNACRVGTCTDAGTCDFAVCPTTACQGSSCVNDACTPATLYGFHAATIALPQGTGVACSGNASACVAAAYPFAFVGTNLGVMAFAVNDPSQSSPPPLPVLGVPFAPRAMAAVGSRVYFMGAITGGGPTWRVPLAWVDVPTDPLVTSLQARTAFDTIVQGGIQAVWPGTDGSLFLADEDSSRAFPLARVKAPLKDGDTATLYPSPGIPEGAVVAIPSGDRAVVARNDTAVFTEYFSLETAAGTSNAQNAGEQSMLAGMGPTSQQATFGQGSDGSVVWNAATVVLDDGGSPLLATARFAWLLSDANATTFDPTKHVDLELYSPPLASDTLVVGPVVPLDTNTALVLAAAHEQTQETSVQVALKTPAPGLAAGRRTVIPTNVGRVGAAVSNGFGYVLEVDATGSLELHVFAPGCAM